MADFDSVRDSINASIKQNGTGAITGPVLNGVLNEMVDAADEQVSQLGQEINGYSTSFMAYGTLQNLTTPILSGMLIKSVTGGNWSSINLYDENGGNQLRLTSSDLPYRTTMRYTKASTFVGGSPKLTINIGSIEDNYILLEGKTTLIDEKVDFLNGENNGFSLSFRASGSQVVLNSKIPVGAVIESVTGSDWASINLYDLEGGNQLNLSPENLPYITTIEYAKASAYIEGAPLLTINTRGFQQGISDVYTDLDGSDSLFRANGNVVNLTSTIKKGTIIEYVKGATWSEISLYDENAANRLRIHPSDLPYTVYMDYVKASAYVEGAPSLILHSIGMVELSSRMREIIYGYKAVFRATGSQYVLSHVIKKGSTISSITGSTWSAVNLYDENGGNQLRLTSSDLPYVTTMEYAKASTYIYGAPALSINVIGLHGLLPKLPFADGIVEAKKYDIGNFDNNFLFDVLNVGRLFSSIIQMIPNFNVPSDGAFISTDITNTEFREEPVTDEQLLRAYVPYFYLNGQKRGTIILFDTDGAPYFYDKNGVKRILNITE